MKKAQNMPYQSRTLGAEAWYAALSGADQLQQVNRQQPE